MMNVIMYSPEYDEIISLSGYPGSLQALARDGFRTEMIQIIWEMSDWIFIGFV